MSGSGPTPLSLQRLSNCLKSVLQLLECPVCLETVPPPAYQCCHGHILCGNCRARSDRCPVCRVSLGSKGRCLLSDKLHHLLTTTLNRTVRNKQSNKQNCIKNNTSHVNQEMPYIYLKSRMVILHELDAVPFNLINVETNKLLRPNKCNQKSTQEVANTSGLQSSSDELKDKSVEPTFLGNMQNAVAYLEVKGERLEILQSEVPSDETKSISTQKGGRRMSVELSSSGIEEEITLRARSLSAEEIVIASNNERLQSNRTDELVFHCPYPTKSIRHCQHKCTGTRELQKHLQEAHSGPLIQYYIKASRSVTKLRLPLSSSRSSKSSLISFTMPDGTVFFIEVAIGATPGHRLVWLWLLDDAIQAEKYRLRLTMPEGDTHTGPVFSLTSSWTDVVNSNCCLSIEEQRYVRRNPEVQIEILDISSKNN
ncbi:hypothetical protein C0J52_02700 [Blattella germanica]|nr:hypothetical protein C0J52_02700 [Blattella germanica]